MMNYKKYSPGYFPAPDGYDTWVKKDHIEKAPAWCSVDLRDGNQALITPMNLEEKLKFFDMLVKIGFKEIEVGFPAASETEFEFVRTLIEKEMVPDDVTLQVLTQCRDHIIRRTFEAVKGAPKAIIHFYNSTSVAQREQVFAKSKEEIKKIATDGAQLVLQLSKEYEGNFQFEYSPESFTGTEMDYALEVCNAVLDVMCPTTDNKMIINLPSTVQMSMPHVYACGDAVYGTKTVIQAVAAGRDAASEIDRALGGDGDISEVLAAVEIPDAYIGRIENFAKKCRKQEVFRGVDERMNFDPISFGIPDSDVCGEAQRCLQCDLRFQITGHRLWSDYTEEAK